jgi:antirestriction protein ArdC
MATAYEKITERILELLSAGEIPWRKPWCAVAAHNSFSGHVYTGINAFILEQGKSYGTFNQLQGYGIRVIKGSKGYPVVFSSPIDQKDKATGKVLVDAHGNNKKFWLQRYYTVFSQDQWDTTNATTTGLRIIELARKENTRTVNTVEVAEKIIGIPHEKVDGGDRAFYSPSKDHVGMPKRSFFHSDAEFYSTNFHELCHLTGHETRLKRDLSGWFGCESYAKEELVSEFGAAFLCDRAGIGNEKTITNSAAYIQNWKKVIEDDPQFALKAASKAKQAANWILDRAGLIEKKVAAKKDAAKKDEEETEEG